MEIRPFQAGDEAAFRELNEAWIVQLFAMEAKDLEILREPVANIIDLGGHILMAISDGEPIGCCAMIPKGERGFELGKMAVKAARRGAGVGRRILASVINHARGLGAEFLYLETSHKLPDAIHLYESVGFTRIPAERIEPSPYARSDIHMEMIL
ncbi:MAG: GNAT family N-acetyltransferase [Acidobacteriota bacterium]|nr:GNAT family N-acetyltransferase [Acidobacteriota bacterium]